MNDIDEKILNDLLHDRRSVVELSDERCRRVLLLLVQKLKRENRK